MAVLLVDDDDGVRRVLGKLLESAGFKVAQAKSGREALDTLGRERFDVLVLDLEMPGLDGFEVLKVTRSRFKYLKVLVLSGYMDGALLQASEFLGADATLNKTDTTRLLVEAVRRLAGDPQPGL